MVERKGVTGLWVIIPGALKTSPFPLKFLHVIIFDSFTRQHKPSILFDAPELPCCPQLPPLFAGHRGFIASEVQGFFLFE